MLIKYKNTKIFAFSDTHIMHWDLFIPKDIDVLICAGDAVEDELDPDNYTDFLNWFESLPAEKHIFIPGDSEHIFTIAPKWGELLFRNRDINLCLDTVIEYNGILFYGLAKPEVSRHAAMAAKNVDFLVTHFPPSMIQGISELHPRYHLYGHDHSMSEYRESLIGTRSYNISKYEELLDEE